VEPLLQVRNLKTYFYTEEGTGKAIDGISFQIGEEKTLGVVGESGCGKSVTALSILGLISSPPGKILEGEILYNSRNGIIDLVKQKPTGELMRSIRGNEIAMIFQEPMTSLNPVYTVGDQIVEAVMLHQRLHKPQAREKATDMLKSVGIPAPEQRFKAYPHELSGGMRQRVMIAMALSCNPKLLIADEPTTALDVTIQAQVLELLAELKSQYKTSMMFITHDLGIVANIADEIIVMYLGKIVEKASVKDLFYNPQHPYTQGLLNSLPTRNLSGKKRLVPISGVVPSLYEKVEGCVFHPRCPLAFSDCRSVVPDLYACSKDHYAACLLRANSRED